MLSSDLYNPKKLIQFSRLQFLINYGNGSFLMRLCIFYQSVWIAKLKENKAELFLFLDSQVNNVTTDGTFTLSYNLSKTFDISLSEIQIFPHECSMLQLLITVWSHQSSKTKYFSPWSFLYWYKNNFSKEVQQSLENENISMESDDSIKACMKTEKFIDVSVTRLNWIQFNVMLCVAATIS